MAAGLNSVSTRKTPQAQSPVSGGAVIVRPPSAIATVTVGSATTPMTLTAAQLLRGFLPTNCTDTATFTLPTATLLNDAQEFAVGDWFEFTIINYGDSTVTVAVGTGITSKVIDSESAILATLATHIGATFILVCTGVAKPGDPTTSDSFDLYLKNTSTCTA